ncbi:flagellar motor switch protein FliM [Nocardioides aquiterrae]|uniref:Flagellar motor switch protein FliM n=1 Tax=Nocardioides aquiterrae TaxID=203799 RepID=A0ABN1UEP0_9ACTN
MLSSAAAPSRPDPAPAGRERRRALNPVPYDFRRPIQLSREHARMLQVAFDGFARQATTVFTSALRTVCSVTLVSVEQRTYAEYVDSLDSSTYLTLFSAEPMHARGVLEIPLVAVMTSIDHMLGGSGAATQPERPLSDIESTVARSLIERLLGEMRYSMAGVVPLEPVVTGVEYSPQFAQVASAADVMVVAVLDLKIGEREWRTTVCLPFGGLLPHLVRASAPAAVSDGERAQQARAAAQLNEGFQRVPVDVAVRARPTALGPVDLATLGVGDVIRLDHPAAAPLEVVVDGTTFAHATAGTRGPRLAALIVGTPKENA